MTLDTKLLQKPNTFDGESNAWSDWSFVFKAYAGAVNMDLQALMHRVVESETQILWETLNDKEQRFSTLLYYLLVMLSKKKALDKVKSVSEGHGLECWRLMHKEWEPKHSGRWGVMLQKILRVSDVLPFWH